MTTDPKPTRTGEDGRVPAPGTTATEPLEAPAVEADPSAQAERAEGERRPRDVAPGTEAPEPTEAAALEDAPPQPGADDDAAGRAGPSVSEAEAAAPSPAADAGAAAPAVEPDYKDLYLRAVAETDNVRKRARRDVAAAEARGLGRLARELLPALDNLDRALAHAEAEEQDEEHHLTKGIRLVQADLVAALARLGIESYSPMGERFDPHHHEAVAQQAVEGAETGTIVEVYQPGYRCGGEILRAAKVVVAT